MEAFLLELSFHTFYRPGHSIWGAKKMALQVILITNKKQMRVKNSNLLSLVEGCTQTLPKVGMVDNIGNELVQVLVTRHGLSLNQQAKQKTKPQKKKRRSFWRENVTCLVTAHSLCALTLHVKQI